MKVAVVGATGAVGQTMLAVLGESGLGVEQLGAFAQRAHSEELRFRGRPVDVQPASDALLSAYDVVFFAGGDVASRQYVPSLLRRGAVVIDNSAAYRLAQGVPLVVPEINPDVVGAGDRLFPVGNCTAIILCMALEPIRAIAGLRSVYVATYQAASGAGRAGLEELAAGERALVYGEAEPMGVVFPAGLARNVVPQVGALAADGWSDEEEKVAQETRKVLGVPDLRISATCVRVPVRTAHAEAVFLTTQESTSVEALGERLARAPGLRFHADGIVTPREVEGSDLVHVARLRAQDSSGRRFALWAVGDQLRKGAATNAVQILQLLVAKGFVRA
ncbi:MAG: aspartate-semialdehyde dehydrogenase [Vulcanimicrobiaceae bacterium]